MNGLNSNSNKPISDYWKKLFDANNIAYNDTITAVSDSKINTPTNSGLKNVTETLDVGTTAHPNSSATLVPLSNQKILLPSSSQQEPGLNDNNQLSDYWKDLMFKNNIAIDSKISTSTNSALQNIVQTAAPVAPSSQNIVLPSSFQKKHGKNTFTFGASGPFASEQSGVRVTAPSQNQVSQPILNPPKRLNPPSCNNARKRKIEEIDPENTNPSSPLESVDGSKKPLRSLSSCGFRAQKRAKVGRKIVDVPFEDNRNLPLNEKIASHISERLKILYENFKRIYALADTKQSSIDDLVVEISKTTLQVGKGTLNEHASHYHPGTGQTDNIKKLIQRQIASNGLKSPKKKLILTARGAQPPHISALETASSASEIKKILNEFWGPSSGSIFNDTEWEVEMNKTHLLPRLYNQSVDRSLENFIRKPLESLLVLVMKKYISSEKAMEIIFYLFKGYYQNALAKTNRNISRINKYEEFLNRVFTSNTLSLDEINKRITALSKIVKKTTGCITIKLPLNQKLLDNLRTNLEDSIPGTISKSDRETIEAELSEIKGKLRTTSEYLTHSITGLQLPEFDTNKNEDEKVLLAIEAIKKKTKGASNS